MKNRMRRWLIARSVRRAFRPPYFERFLLVQERKSAAMAIYLQARRSTGRMAMYERKRFRNEHLTNLQ